MNFSEIIKTKNKFLILDSSSKWLYIAFLIQENGKIKEIIDKSEENYRNSFQKSASYLKELFDTFGFPEIIIAGLGPGSFTGIRITVSTARTLSQLLNISIIGIDTLTLYGYSLYLEKRIKHFLLGIDAKQKKYFCKIFNFENDFHISDILELDLETIYNLLLEKKIPFFVDDKGLIESWENVNIQFLPLFDAKNFFYIFNFTAIQQNFDSFFYENYKNVLPIYIRKDPANERFSYHKGQK